MTPAERIDTLIARLHALAQRDEDIDISWAGRGTEQALTAVEQALGVRIAGSFRDFILRTGGGGLDLFPISAIPADAPLGGYHTVYGDTLYWRHDAGGTPLPQHLVVIQRDLDDNEPFCLDTSRVVNGENPVVLFYPGSRSGHVDRIAPAFLDFYEAYLAPHFEQ